MARDLTLRGVIAVVLFAWAASASAVQATEVFGAVAPVSLATLQSERAGFITVDGIELSFGAILQTTVGGQLAIVTTLSLDQSGAPTKTTWVNPALANSTSWSAASGLDLAGVQGEGVVIKSDSGVTALVTNVSGSQLQNLVVNTANHQIITQSTTITLTLPGFGGAMGQFQASQVMQGVNNALQFTRVAGALH